MSNTEVAKLLNLKALAENTPYGFSTEPRIIRHPLPGTGNTLPKRQPDNPIPQLKPPKRPKAHFTTEASFEAAEDIQDRDAHLANHLNLLSLKI